MTDAETPTQARVREAREKKEAEAQAAAVQAALDAHKSLTQALAWVAGQTGKIPKTGVNKHFGYSYVTKDDIVEHLKPLLLHAGLIIIPRHLKTERSEPQSNGMVDLIVSWEMLIIHGPTGSSMAIPWESEAMDNQDKGFAKATTSAMKQFVQALFDIPSGELDVEHDAHSQNVREGSGQTQSAARPSGNVSVKALLDYKAENSVTTAQVDWVLTSDAVGEKAGTKFKDIDSSKWPTILAGMQHVVAERAKRDPDTGEPLNAADAGEPEPDEAPREPNPDDDIPF